jgi:hypothetical protein
MMMEEEEQEMTRVLRMELELETLSRPLTVVVSSAFLVRLASSTC